MKSEIFDHINAIIGSLILMAICIPLTALAVMFLWNFLAPTFGLPTLSWIEAMVLECLCGVLFRSSNIGVKTK